MIKLINQLGWNRLFVFTISGLITACGPIHQTKYFYTPPSSVEGRTCLFQCENNQIQCEQLEEMKQESCELRAELACNNQENCSRPRICRANLKRCEQVYRNCYQACGGTVQSQQVCILNCN